MTRKTLKKVKSQKKSKSQLRKTRKVRKHKVGGAVNFWGVAKAASSGPTGPRLGAAIAKNKAAAAIAKNKAAAAAARSTYYTGVRSSSKLQPARRLYTTPEDAARRAAANAIAHRDRGPLPFF
jgi:hypothetical protein